MERGLTCTTASASRPCSLSHGIPTRFQMNHPPSINLRKNPIAIKAINNSRGTISSDWSVSPSPPTWLPKFDELDSASMLLRQRIVFLGSQVDDMIADLLVAQMLFLDAEDPTKEIKLFINSPGGSVTAGMGIYDAMKLCKADVSTVCFGLAASMGAFLLASGTRGKRFCMPNARIMIHQPRGNLDGEFADMMLQQRELNYHLVKVNKILERITGHSEAKIEHDTRRDFFMSPTEAEEYGLIDAVIEVPGLVAPEVDYTPPPESKSWYQWNAGRDLSLELPSEEIFLEKDSDEQTDIPGRGPIPSWRRQPRPRTARPRQSIKS